MRMKEPVTLDAAKSEMSALQARLVAIDAELGNKVLEDEHGNRLTNHEYWQERENIKDEKLEALERYRFLKDWIRRKSGELNKSLRDEFAMHCLPPGWKPNTDEDAKDMAQNCYRMADAMLEARK